MPTCYVPLGRFAKHISWRCAHARNSRAELSRGLLRFQLAGTLPPSHCKTRLFARVAELADAYGSGPYGATRGGSSPLASSYRFVQPTVGSTSSCSMLVATVVAISSRLSFCRPSALSLVLKVSFGRQV